MELKDGKKGLELGIVSRESGLDHSHLNKVTLDLIEQALTTALKIAYDDAVTKAHEHTNKAVLDLVEEALTSALKTAYDDAVTKAHVHVNKSILDAIEESFTTALKAAYDSCVVNEHIHANKVVLDLVEEALTSALKTAYDDAVTKAHIQNTDQKLDEGGVNEVSVAGVKDAVDKKHDRLHSINDTNDHSGGGVEDNFIAIDSNGLPKDSGKSALDFTLSSEWNQNGFEDISDSTLTWTDSTPDRTLSIQPTGTSFDYYIAGVKYTSTGDTVQITDVEGVHYIYYDGDTLTVVANPSFINRIITIETKAIVSIVYWNATDKKGIYIGEERHGKSMSPLTHSYLHFTEGLRYINGIGLNTLSVDQNGNDNEDAQFGVDSGAVADEDLFLSISSIDSTTGLPIYYMTGSIPTWNKSINTGYSVIKTGVGGEDRLAYNQYIGGSWQLTEVDNLKFVLCHIFVTTEKDKPMIAVVGQNTYVTATQARTGAKSEIQELVLNDILFPEIRPIATVIFQTKDGYANTMKARVISTDEGDDYIDWRSEVISRVTVSTSNHNALSGLQGGTTDEKYHLTNDQHTNIGIRSGHITIFPVSYNIINQGIFTWSFNSQHLYGAVWYNSSASDGDSLTYKVALDKGTYTLTQLGTVSSDYGILKIDIGGNNVAIFDNYNVSTIRNMMKKQTGIVIPSEGLKDLTLYIDGKNASSTGYYMSLQHIVLWRTA